MTGGTIVDRRGEFKKKRELGAGKIEQETGQSGKDLLYRKSQSAGHKGAEAFTWGKKTIGHGFCRGREEGRD